MTVLGGVLWLVSGESCLGAMVVEGWFMVGQECRELVCVAGGGKGEGEDGY